MSLFFKKEYINFTNKKMKIILKKEKKERCDFCEHCKKIKAIESQLKTICNDLSDAISESERGQELQTSDGALPMPDVSGLLLALK